MIKDDFVVGNYLLVAGYAIYTTPDFVKLDLIAGDPSASGYQIGVGSSVRFGSLTGIITNPTSSEHIWVADHTSACIRSISRRDNQSLHLTGVCEDRGVRDGSFGTAIIGYPIGMAKVSSHATTIYFFDNLNQHFRCLTRGDSDWEVISLFSLRLNVNRFVFEPTETYAYISHNHGITRVRLTWQSSFEEIISLDNGAGHNDGPLAQAQVRKPLDLYFFDENKLLLADNKNHVIRMIDLLTSEISTICQPQTSDVSVTEGDIEDCKIRFPNQVFPSYESSTLYILGDSEIYSLAYFGELMF